MERLYPAVTSRPESLQEPICFRCEGPDRRPLWLIYTPRCDLASMLKHPLRYCRPGPIIWRRRSGLSSPLNFHGAPVRSERRISADLINK